MRALVHCCHYCKPPSSDAGERKRLYAIFRSARSARLKFVRAILQQPGSYKEFAGIPEQFGGLYRREGRQRDKQTGK